MDIIREGLDEFEESWDESILADVDAAAMYTADVYLVEQLQDSGVTGLGWRFDSTAWEFF